MRGIKIVLCLLRHRNGLTYIKISEKTNLHINTVSRIISEYSNEGYVDIGQKKGKQPIGRRWTNIVYPSSKLIHISKNYNKFLDFLNLQLEKNFGQVKHNGN